MRKIFLYMSLVVFFVGGLEANLDLKINSEDAEKLKELIYIQKLNDETSKHRKRGDFQKAIDINQLIIDKYKIDNQFAKFVAFAYISKATDLWNLEKIDEALKIFKDFKSKFEIFSYNNSFIDLISYSYAMCSRIYQDKEEFQKAIDTNYELLAWAEANDITKIKDVEVKYEVFYSIGYLYGLLGNFPKSIESYDKVIEVLKNRDKVDNVLTLSLINKFELSLVTDKFFFEEMEFYKAKYLNEKEFVMFVELLEILYITEESSQELMLKRWQKVNKDRVLENWSFDFIDEWIEKMDTERKNRLKNIVKIFKSYLPKETK